ncbi:MAG: alpha/beta hydrolase [Steroidobacteraceae bacterium]
MALFEYFPNYVWNLSVAMALESGGRIGEIIDMCAPLRDRATKGEDIGTDAFLAAWMAKAGTLLELAADDESRGRRFSASDKLHRAALYLFVAERMQGHGHPGRAETYARAREAFERAIVTGREPVRRVEVPLEHGTMPALFVQGEGEGPLPAVVYCNGLDSCKELLYWSKLPHALARRGISTLCVDQPGSGEALRLQGLSVAPHSETWASKAVDWLQRIDAVEPTRIGMTGISLGGHFAPRAVAFEPRFASGAVWGANHDWAEVQQKRLRREGENPVPHYWAHVHWAFGAADREDFLRKAVDMRLDGILDRIRVPFLVTHGERDRQISLDYALRTFEQLTASPRRELKVFTAREGGVEHVGADNMSFGRDYIADWFAETLGGHTG